MLLPNQAGPAKYRNLFVMCIALLALLTTLQPPTVGHASGAGSTVAVGTDAELQSVIGKLSGTPASQSLGLALGTMANRHTQSQGWFTFVLVLGDTPPTGAAQVSYGSGNKPSWVERVVMAFEPEGLSSVPVQDFIELAYQTSPSNPNLNGICAVIAALESLENLGFKSQSELVDANGKYKKSVLTEFKKMHANPQQEGSSQADQDTMHVQGSSGRLVCQRGETGLYGLKACEALKQRVEKTGEDTEDCTAHMVFPKGPDLGAGHAAHISGVTLTKNGCILNMPDTMDQGDGQGNGVAHARGATQLEVAANPKGSRSLASYTFSGTNEKTAAALGGVVRLYFTCCQRDSGSGEYE